MPSHFANADVEVRLRKDGATGETETMRRLTYHLTDAIYTTEDAIDTVRLSLVHDEDGTRTEYELGGKPLTKAGAPHKRACRSNYIVLRSRRDLELFMDAVPAEGLRGMVHGLDGESGYAVQFSRADVEEIVGHSVHHAERQAHWLAARLAAKA